MENLKRLITAMRSEKYIKARFNLKTGDDCFCVFGLACELYRQEKGKGHRWNKAGYFITPDNKKGYVQCPPEVIEWLGLKEHETVVRVENHKDEYGVKKSIMWSVLNDSPQFNLSFPQMANIFEKYYFKGNMNNDLQIVEK